MIRNQPRQVEYQEETVLVCDYCEREITPEGHSECNEALQLRLTGGYGSVFGAGAQVEADLCQHCAKELIGPSAASCPRASELMMLGHRTVLAIVHSKCIFA